MTIRQHRYKVAALRKIETHLFHHSRGFFAEATARSEENPEKRTLALAEADAVASEIDLSVSMSGLDEIEMQEYGDRVAHYDIVARLGDRIEATQIASFLRAGDEFWDCPDANGFARRLCVPDWEREVFDGRLFCDWVDDALLRRMLDLPYRWARAEYVRAEREANRAEAAAARAERETKRAAAAREAATTATGYLTDAIEAAEHVTAAVISHADLGDQARFVVRLATNTATADVLVFVGIGRPIVAAAENEELPADWRAIAEALGVAYIEDFQDRSAPPWTDGVLAAKALGAAKKSRAGG